MISKIKEKKVKNSTSKTKNHTLIEQTPFKKKSKTNLSTVASYAAFTTTSFSQVNKNSK